MSIETTARPTVHSTLWRDTVGRFSIRSTQVMLIGLLFACILIGLLKITVIVIPTLIAVIIACSMWPMVVKLRQKFNPLVSAWIAFLGALLALGGVGAALVSSVIKEWPQLVGKAGEGFAQFGSMIRETADRLPTSFGSKQVDELVAEATKFLTSSQFGTGALNTLSAAGSIATSTALLLVILFFLLKDGDKIWIFLVSWMPKHTRRNWSLSGNRAVRTFGGYVRGTALIAAVDALGITITLLILRVPLAIPLGIIVFLGSFVPLVGASVAGVLATLVALVTNGPVVALIVLAAVIVINQLEGNFLQPVVMANALNLHALVVLMALTAGSVLGGIVGAVLSVPLTAAGWAVLKVWTGRDSEFAADTEKPAEELPVILDDEPDQSVEQLAPIPESVE